MKNITDYINSIDFDVNDESLDGADDWAKTLANLPEHEITISGEWVPSSYPCEVCGEPTTLGILDYEYAGPDGGYHTYRVVGGHRLCKPHMDAFEIERDRRVESQVRQWYAEHYGETLDHD